MKFRILCLLLVTMAWSGVRPAMAEETDRQRAFTAVLYGGFYLNNAGGPWIVEPAIQWSFHKYLGVSLGFEMTSQFGNERSSIMINGREAWLQDSDRNVAWVIFKPALVVRSPNVWQSGDGELRLWFQAEPGVSLAIPSRNSMTYEFRPDPYGAMPGLESMKFPNRGLSWFYWNARVSLNFAYQRVLIGLNYSLSDLDYYAGRRNVTFPDGHKYEPPHKRLSHSLTLSVGYSF